MSKIQMTQKQALEWVLLSLERGKIENGIEMLKDILKQMPDKEETPTRNDDYDHPCSGMSRSDF